MKILLTWIGRTDFMSIGNEGSDIGPIAQALKADKYDYLYLLNNYADADVQGFKTWIKHFTRAEIICETVILSSPTNHQEIYPYVRKTIENVLVKFHKPSLTFHTSPGTPAMALSWMLLSSVYDARIIESSKEAGVKTVTLPFEIAAYFLPDKELIKLSKHSVKTDSSFKDIIHVSSVMQDAVYKAKTVAPRDITVLLEGESGTGKELFARAIHRGSHRSEAPFVAVNCGSLPSELIESTLFGYEKGAFTGATQKTEGKFHEANGGTLFLDELGEISHKAQVALLRALQENEITRVGSSKVETTNVRIIAATNKILLEEVAKGNFRADLFYRLAVACIYLPPLRERGEDISLLIDDATKKANVALSIQNENEHKKFSHSAKKVMLSHPWLGNIRELYNTVTRAILWSPSRIIDEGAARQALFQMPKEQGGTSQESLLDYELGNGFSIENLIDTVKSTYVDRALKEANGNKTKASQLLGLKNYQTFTNWLKQNNKDS